MKVRDLVIDHNGTAGKTAIVKTVRAKFKYVDNHRTAEQEGYTIECVLPERGYNDLTVAVTEIPEELVQYTGNPVVQFDNLTLFTYGPQADLKVGARASSARIIGGKAKA